MPPSTSSELWVAAVKRYEETTKKKFKDLPRPDSADDLVREVRVANQKYEAFRAKSSMFYKVLSAIAAPIELVGNLASGAGSAAFPPSSMVFGAVAYLIQAAKGVSAILDAVSELMTELQDLSVRLKVYDKGDLSEELRKKLTEILTAMVEILALSTKKVKDPAFRGKAYLKNVFLGNDTKMQDLLKKLDRLTRSENLLVGAETFVEVQSTGKGVQSLQVSMAAMQVSADMTSQDIAAIRSNLDESRAQHKEDSSHSQREALKKVLNPSVTALDKLEQIKRERRIVPHSGDWILTEEVFSSWVARKEQPLLWIAGSPGSGKSFLTYNILTCLQNQPREQSSPASYGVIVGFFFFQDNSAVTQSVQQALCDVAFQLTQVDAAYFKYLNTAGLSAVDLQSVRLAWKVLFADYWLTERAPNAAYIILDGLDEASPQHREVFIDLLKDVEDLGATCKLRVAMLGRPHIVEEMCLSGLREPPTIYVDVSKNGSDIALYVQSSIAKSQALKRISPKMKATIIETLTNKAGGMFMWAKLMITELNRKAQRSRESEVEKVLNEAPKGLTEMIQRVLEGYSSSLSADEADDLNTMLMWVTLARRPLCLGELDAALRLKSEEGSGLVFLEGMLRKTYASLFTLSREDGLTTSELLAPDGSPDYDEFSGTEGHTTAGYGEEDLDYPAEFNSNPRTTTVSFSHASISDYFSSLSRGKVTAKEDGACAIGVDLDTAHLVIGKACVDIIADTKYRSRMGDAVSLLDYAQKNWLEHLEHVKRDSADEAARLSMARQLAKMLHDEAHLQSWAGARSALFFTSLAADRLVLWLKDSLIFSQLDAGITEWLNSIDADKNVHVFRHSMQYIAKQWIGISDSSWNAASCPVIIHSWLARTKGLVIDSIPKLTADEIVAAAQFGGFEENAEFHRRLGMSLRELGHFEQAKQRFEKALELQPDMWRAKRGIAQVHFQQKEYQLCLALSEDVTNAIEALSGEISLVNKNMANTSHKAMAECYEQLVEQLEDYPSEKALELDIKACHHFYRAFQWNKKDYASAGSCLEYWQYWADHGLPFMSESKYTTRGDVPGPDQCFKETMSIAHQLDDYHDDETGHWLWFTTQYDELFETNIARAASETGELEWLQNCYLQAISKAGKALKPVARASMVLSLAILCDQYINDGEKALWLYESLLSERALTTRERSEIMWTRREALRMLSIFCVRKSLEDESQSERYIGKLEKIWQRGRRDAAVGVEEMALPSHFAIQLGMWYFKMGRHDEAREIVRAHMKKAFALLSDDDPTNDWDGYLDLAHTLLAVRDDRNTTAVLHLLRHFRAGAAVLSSDDSSDSESEDDDDSNDNDDDDDVNDDNSDDYRDMIDEMVVCNGPCDNDAENYDNTFTCRYDMITLCDSCHTQLQAGFSLPDSKCCGSHEFLEVTPLTTRFKKGEIVVDGVAMDLDAWKQDIKQQWGL